MTRKNIILTIVITLAIAGVIALIWYLFFKPASPAIPPQSAGFTTPGQEAITKKLMRISEGPAISGHFSDNDSILFYDFSGKLWRFGTGDPKPAPTEQTTIGNPAETIWSKNGESIVKSGLNQSDINYVFSDFDKKIFTNLKAGIKSAVISPDGGKIAYYISDGMNSNSLYTITADGKNQKTLTGALKLRDINLAWPKNNIISATSKPSGLLAGNLWTLNTTTLGITKLLDGEMNGLFGLETLWSPDGDSFIYSYVDQNGQNPKLVAYKNGISKNIENISTIVDKCAWAKDSIYIYCAVPQSWPNSATLLDNYYKNIFLTTDGLWKINTETGEKNLILQGIGDISNLDTAPDDTSLIFIFRNNSFLYRFNLR